MPTPTIRNASVCVCVCVERGARAHVHTDSRESRTSVAWRRETRRSTRPRVEIGLQSWFHLVGTRITWRNFSSCLDDQQRDIYPDSVRCFVLSLSLSFSLSLSLSVSFFRFTLPRRCKTRVRNVFSSFRLNRAVRHNLREIFASKPT